MAGFSRRPRSYMHPNAISNRYIRRQKSSVDEEVVELDSNNDVKVNIEDVLVHLVRNDCVNKTRKLAYMNAFVRYYKEISHGTDIGYTDDHVIYCLRSCMLHRYSVVRAAAFRCLRYFIDSDCKVKLFFDLKLDWCVVRSLDLHMSYDVERTQAIRLCRHLVQLNPQVLQPSIVLPFIALASDGSKSNERMVLISLEYLCELAYKNSALLARCGGVQVILQHIMQCHDNPRVNEALLQTVVYMLNNPQSRVKGLPSSDIDWCVSLPSSHHYSSVTACYEPSVKQCYKAGTDSAGAAVFRLPRRDVAALVSKKAEQLLAPFTDSHYRHILDSSDNASERAEQKAARFQEERLLRCKACSQALLCALHTWPGLVSLCSPHNTALSSLVNALHLSTHETQKIILQLVYNIFHLRLPKYTTDFDEALYSCDPCNSNRSWILQEGFVASECLSLYKENCSRPNLIDSHLALLLSSFISYGMLEALCGVVIQSDSSNSIWATILLGELLHMSYSLLPWCDSEQTHYLPVLVTAVNSDTNTREQRMQAHQAVGYLDRLHSLKKRGKMAFSLHLELLISFIPDTESQTLIGSHKHKSTKEKLEPYLPQESEESLLQLIRESHVLVELNPHQWRWLTIKTILKGHELMLRKVEDFTLHRFLSKLLHFYNPSVENGFCTVKLDDGKARLYTSIGLLLLEKILLINADESNRHLKSLLLDICHCLSELRQEVPVQEAKLGLNYIYSYCCQNYFLFIGKLSQSSEGMVLLESTGIMQQLLDLVTITGQDVYVKLTVSSLDYTKEGICRIILSKALTATSENARLYTADFMRALLRLGVPFFSNWCMELLIKQLYDQSKNVSMRSLSVINEACENQANLLSLIAIRPSVLHLGEMGALLVTRYLSLQEGYKFLSQSSYLTNELDRWHHSFNIQYADMVDELLAESLSSYEKSYDDEVQRRSSSTRQLGKSVYIPPHLYGQLIQHSEGAETVANLPYLSEYFDIVRGQNLCDEDIDIKQHKAALWVAGHIGSSIFGLELLSKQEVISSLIWIAQSCQILTLRGIAFYALGLIATTQAGVNRLAQLGWRSVMSTRADDWPLLSDQLLYSDPDTVREIRSFSQASSISQSSSSGNPSDATDTSSFTRFDLDEVARSRASTDDIHDKMRTDLNEDICQDSTEHLLPPVRDSKSHSTSELAKRRTEAMQHRRCSSDSFNTWKVGALSPIVIEDDHFASGLPLTAGNSAGSNPVDMRNGSVTVIHTTSTSDDTRTAVPFKSAIKHKASKSLIDMGTEPMTTTTKSRSLSWRSDVRETATPSSSSVTNIKHHLHTESFSSQVSSADSAISQTSISPIDTDKAHTAQHTMSLTRKLKGKPAKRKMRFSSLQNPVNKYDSLPRGVYIAHMDELGQAVVRAMRRQASSASSTDSHCASTHSNPATPKITSKFSRVIRTLSAQGDIESLSDIRKLSDIDHPASFSVKYIGLALPLDVLSLFELPYSPDDEQDLSYCENRAFGEVDDLKPISQGVEGLELHSSTNCLSCLMPLSNEQPHAVQTASDVTDTSVKLDLIQTVSPTTLPAHINHYIDGKVSERTPVGRSLLRKECIKFITTICSSIGVNAAEEGLLRLKEQFPDIFNDLCLYSEVSAILSNYSFHLPARKFIQELFQETPFDKIGDDVIHSLKIDVNQSCCEKHKNS